VHCDGGSGRQSIFVRASVFEFGRCADSDGAKPSGDDTFFGFGFDENRERGRSIGTITATLDGGDGKIGGRASDDPLDLSMKTALGEKNLILKW